jgi:hypothetical protein
MLQARPKLCPRESQRNKLQPTPAKIEVEVESHRHTPEEGACMRKRLPGGKQSMLNSPYQFQRKESLNFRPYMSHFR